jgi:septum site-determining protein MinC
MKENSVERVGLPSHSSNHSKESVKPDLNSLLVKLSVKDEVVTITIDEKVPMDLIVRDLEVALEFASDEFSRKCVRLHIGSRYPEKVAIRNLSRILKSRRSLTLVGVHCTQDAMRRFASREHRLCFDECEENTVEVEVTETVEPAKNATHKNLSEQPSNLQIMYKTLRSGAVLRVENNLIIYGDINAGAVVEAGGSVTVFGAIRGSVHAGLSKTDKAYVMAVTLQPTQLKIGLLRANPEVLQEIPRRWSPAIAHISKGKIVVEDFRRSSIRPNMEEQG